MESNQDAETKKEATKPFEPTQPKQLARRPDRVLITGKADLDQCDNKVISARYTLLSFLPVVRKK
jgi:hypothetical protein